MGFVIFTFCVVFLLIVSGGLLLFYREEMLQRISDAINPQPKPKSLLSTIQQTGLSIGGVVEHFETVLPKSQAEVSIVLQRLQRAGFRDESAVKIFYGSKVSGSSPALHPGFGYRTRQHRSGLWSISSPLALGFLAAGFLAGKAN